MNESWRPIGQPIVTRTAKRRGLRGEFGICACGGAPRGRRWTTEGGMRLVRRFSAGCRSGSSRTARRCRGRPGTPCRVSGCAGEVRRWPLQAVDFSFARRAVQDRTSVARVGAAGGRPSRRGGRSGDAPVSPWGCRVVRAFGPGWGTRDAEEVCRLLGGQPSVHRRGGDTHRARDRLGDLPHDVVHRFGQPESPPVAADEFRRLSSGLAEEGRQGRVDCLFGNANEQNERRPCGSRDGRDPGAAMGEPPTR